MLTKVATSVRNCLLAAERLHSPSTLAHEDRVGQLCTALGEILHFDAAHLTALHYAAGLHDIGKLGVPGTIIDDPSALKPDDWIVMCNHPQFGWDILKTVDDPLVSLAAGIALQHHEHWDGSGYPAGLKGDAIMQEARIVTLCDVYDAIRGARPYKASASHEQAVHIILHGDPNGRTHPAMFDPALLAILETDATALELAFDATPA